MQLVLSSDKLLALVSTILFLRAQSDRLTAAAATTTTTGSSSSTTSLKILSELYTMLKSCFQPQLVLTENTVNYKALCWFSVRTSQRTLTHLLSIKC